ncbi:TetR/AcrR family transcriptional regulator [Paenibacillus guangzhouensis]|uniref:TetR/AcrR family transcriptional regulator n=1 Tax=Paenibacillus guangzhouensis TaxID=1473112 RepID=UPI0012673B89|nr:TetR/AcrR family transcriptional regulator [Paenibacillus guangzhouensis]
MRVKPKTRDHIVEIATRLFFVQGYHATGLNQIIQESQAPKGSLYYYFPNGKEELAQVCIEQQRKHTAEILRSNFTASNDFVTGVQAFFLGLVQEIERQQFQGVPPSCFWNAVETSCISNRLREACQDTFDMWKSIMVERLLKEGHEEKRAESIAMGVFSLLEGSFVLALTYRDANPLINASNLIPLLLISESN